MNFGKILYGGDYNPEQWLDHPELLEKDIEYMKEAHINLVSMGIFSWAMLEPEEGTYNFSWLEENPDGWRRNTRRSAGWMRTGTGSCTAEGITTAILPRSTGKRCGASIWN